MDAFQRSVLECCDSVFDEVIDFTKDMVRQHSVLNHEQGVLDTVETRFKGLDFPVQRVGMQKDVLSQSPLYAPVPWDHETKYNLVSSFNPNTEGKALVFNGHIDVVGAGARDMWTRPPNDPYEKDGWLYGRGAGDMLSGVAAMIYAAHAVRRAGREIVSPFSIQAVVEEECSGNGALACAQQGFGGDFVLIPEPFGPQIYAAQIGVLWFKIRMRGTPAHVLDTSAGVNAIEKLYLLTPVLKQLEEQLNDRRHRTAPYEDLEKPYNINIGKISGGDWASSVPAQAALEGRLGFPIGMTANQAMQAVNDAIETFARTHPAFEDDKPTLRFHGFRSEGHVVETSNPGVQTLSKCHQALIGAEPAHYISTCTTDLRAFHFYSRTPGTCYGPIAKRIHGIDECVDIESVRHTLKAYALFITEWCRLQ